MNGRVYDPAIGRFTSADPLIDGPFNSQGWNRYAYVHNRPMSATDPSGYATDTDLQPEVAATVLGQRLTGVSWTGQFINWLGVDMLDVVVLNAQGFLSSLGGVAPPIEAEVLVEASRIREGKGGGGGGAPTSSRPQGDSRCEQALPDGSTVANNVRTIVHRAMAQATNPRSSDAAIFQTYGYWFARVREGGDWDYKRQPGGTEEIGNFNYGATGAVLFHRNILERAAGAIQLLTLPSASDGGSPIGSWPYGDQVQDQRDITAGISAGCP